MALDDYLTTSEAAALKNVSVEHLTRLIRQGQLPATKKGGIWLIHKPDLDIFDSLERLNHQPANPCLRRLLSSSKISPSHLPMRAPAWAAT